MRKDGENIELNFGRHFEKVSGLSVSGIEHQVSGFGCRVSGIRYQVSGIRFRVSGQTPSTVSCLLLSAYWPTAFCFLPTATCLLPSAFCLLPPAYCFLSL